MSRAVARCISVIVFVLAIAMSLFVITFPARADIVPGAHGCTNFGATVDGYRGGMCTDVDLFINSGGDLAVRGRGQAFCQRASDEVIVQCAGIFQEIVIKRVVGDSWDTITAFSLCGRYTTPWHDPPCPSGRLQDVTAAFYAECWETYFVDVQTYVRLPVSGSTQVSSLLTLSEYTHRGGVCDSR